ncbi:dUTP diphosphatase [Marihabitans asiaticum]|uniref:Deoxyuridine 5'-triphosphate nucleotidohydrolase n=1 Tax=Marihabitans asiaticum TaxID=415218 RepID=A0A560W6V4_9MICO|nr:dUTP diphosphatase [Marihabitans asiaticum]TWD13348.1 dUTP pyrophosphatase [Marihabitans asiaticum]
MTTRPEVQVRRLHPDAVLPAYAKDGDAGADLTAVASVTLRPGQRALVPTGIAIALPEGWVGLVHPRSGLAARHGVSVVNAPGTVDSGYRGEVLVNLINLDLTDEVVIRRGDRVAQLVIQQVAHAELVEVDSLPASQRGDTGHGSSGGFMTQEVDETDVRT